MAVAGLVDGGRTDAKREPTHNDLNEWVERFWLSPGDPQARGETVGKFKRGRGALYWALGDGTCLDTIIPGHSVQHPIDERVATYGRVLAFEGASGCSRHFDG